MIGAILMGLLACTGGERSSSAPTVPPAPDTTDVVRRGTLDVTVRVNAADCPIAEQLSLACSAPAGVRVTLTRDASSTLPPLVAATDAEGRVRFGDLLEGAYGVSVERVVSPEERARLGALDADVTAFGGGARVTVRPGRNEANLDVIAGRRGTLVISEIWGHRPNHYGDAGYIELYNNGDSPVFLDGMLLALVAPVMDMLEPSPPWLNRCEIFSSVRTNSIDLGVSTIAQFPGSGTEFPVPPGRAVVIATDAIDHREFAPGALDLSRADFEFLGDTRDVDNPAVPNLTRVRGGLGVFGHGISGINLLSAPVVLARRPVAPLRTETVGGGDHQWGIDLPFVPREDVLDLVGFSNDPEAVAQLAAAGFTERLCDPWLHPVWERSPAPIAYLDNLDDEAKGHNRRVAYVTPEGRVVLQRTRTSARDWVYGPPATPGTVVP